MVTSELSGETEMLFLYLGSSSMSVNIGESSLSGTPRIMHFIVCKPYLNLKNESIQHKESTATRIKGKNHEIRMLGKNWPFQVPAQQCTQGIFIIKI